MWVLELGFTHIMLYGTSLPLVIISSRPIDKVKSMCVYWGTDRHEPHRQHSFYVAMKFSSKDERDRCRGSKTFIWELRYVPIKYEGLTGSAAHIMYWLLFKPREWAARSGSINYIFGHSTLINPG